jgi:hypothetical protein
MWKCFPWPNVGSYWLFCSLRAHTKQRTAYALMLYVGAARGDAHRITWPQFDDASVEYTRRKTGVGVAIAVHSELQKALAAAPRDHVTILTTAFGKPFTVDGFSSFLRDAITAAGLPLDYTVLEKRLEDEWRMPDVPTRNHGNAGSHDPNRGREIHTRSGSSARWPSSCTQT